MAVNQMQKYEWMLRIVSCNLKNGLVLLRRIPDPQPADESELLNAMQAMEAAVYSIFVWCYKNGVTLHESMPT